MTVESSLPIVLAQMGHVEKIAHNETTTPEAQRESAKHMAAESLKHDQKTIERTQNSGASQLLLDKDGGRGGAQGRKKPRNKAPRADEAEDQEEASGSPWQGNILNMKV